MFLSNFFNKSNSKDAAVSPIDEDESKPLTPSLTASQYGSFSDPLSASRQVRTAGLDYSRRPLPPIPGGILPVVPNREFSQHKTQFDQPGQPPKYTDFKTTPAPPSSQYEFKLDLSRRPLPPTPTPALYPDQNLSQSRGRTYPSEISHATGIKQLGDHGTHRAQRFEISSIPPPPTCSSDQYQNGRSSLHQPSLLQGSKLHIVEFQQQRAVSPNGRSWLSSSERDEKVHTEAHRVRRVKAAVQRLVFDWWLLEIASWTFSAISMFAIIGVLLHYNGKSLSQWKLGLTLNTFIALIFGFTKVTLLFPVVECLGQLKWHWFKADSNRVADFEVFDRASRGPWGSFLLLIRTRGRSVATVGAIIVLLALPLDLFFQRIIEYPERFVPVPNMNGTIRRAVTYAPGSPFQVQDGVKVSLPDYQMLSAIFPFFIGNGTDDKSEPDLLCPTNSCSWPPFDTLAVCSACADISDILQYSCKEVDVDWTANLRSPNTTLPKLGACGYFINATDANATLMTGHAIDNSTGAPVELLQGRTLPFVDPKFKTSAFGGSIMFKNILNPITDVIIASTPGGVQGILGNSTPTCTECVLYWCTKTLTSALHMGVLSENVTNTSLQTGSVPYPWSTRISNGNVLQGYANNITITPTSENLTFGLSNVTADRTNILFDSNFPSTTVCQNATSAPQYVQLQPQSLGPIVQTPNFNPWIAPNNLTDHFQRLAQAMSNTVRSGSEPGGLESTIMGLVLENDTMVRISWPWFSLPACLLLLSLFVLVVTIRKGSEDKAHIGVWKSSALATLVHGFRSTGEVQTLLGPGYSLGETRKKANEARAKLFPD